MYHYCLFCLTQRSEIIKQLIERQYGYKVISPKIIQRHWVHGQKVEKEYQYLPGYLFIYTDEPIESVTELRRINGVIRQLGELNTGFQLNGSDLTFSEFLLTRGELEITTLNEMYLNDGLLDVQLLGKGFTWLDTDTMSSLLQAANFVETIQTRQGIVLSAPEEIAYINGFVADGSSKSLWKEPLWRASDSSNRGQD